MQSVYIKNGQVKGTFVAPSNKSEVLRYLLIGALAQDESVIRKVSINDDVIAMINCLREMGAIINITDLKDGTKISIKKGIDFHLEDVSVHVGASIETFKLLEPIVTLFNSPINIVVDNGLIKKNPSLNEDTVRMLSARQGNIFTINTKLRSHSYDINSNMSTTSMCGLLIALPKMRTDSFIHVASSLRSPSLVDITIDCLRASGVVIEKRDEYEYYIKGNQAFEGFDVTIEGDYAIASHFMCLAAYNGNIKFRNLNTDTIQGEKKIIEILSLMGVSISEDDEGYNIKKTQLKPIDVSVDDSINLSLIVIAMCSVLNGISYIRGINLNRKKDYQRISLLTEELQKLGSYIEIEEKCIKVYGGISIDGTLNVSTHSDYRIAMALSIIASCFKQGIHIDGVECVEKIYPEFYYELERLGLPIVRK